ncbi:MAG: ABC transporter permease [Candidatus Omnitrophica bacterium]|nr:ABC transporter permease [Candidatus Omnitrophota bacterium]
MGAFIRDNLTSIGTKTIGIIRYTGAISILIAEMALVIIRPPFRIRQSIRQIKMIGTESLPIVTLISFFTGMVLALQSAYQMQKISAEMYIASLVALSMTRELGPVLTALIVAGRCGASITAELGTMRVTEQIDALETMGTNPLNYLVIPRFWALLISLPILTIFADVVGMLGGYVIGCYKLHITHHMYIRMTFDPLKHRDIFNGLIKSVVFAIIICVIACFEGLNTREGAEGVGKATTSSVVRSFILIIAADCLLTALFYFIGKV